MFLCLKRVELTAHLFLAAVQRLRGCILLSVCCLFVVVVVGGGGGGCC